MRCGTLDPANIYSDRSKRWNPYKPKSPESRATILDYDEQSGRLEETEVLDAAAQTSLLHLTYERDDNGFVDRRTEHAEGREEVFHLDGHHRLKEWLLDYGKGGAGSGSQASIYTYDSIDNLEKVSVSGSAIVKYEELFTHGSSGKPHALYNRAKKADPQTFFYDARGRLLDGDGQQYAYTSFDLPRSITTPAGVTQFKYDASGSRVRKQGPSGTTTSLRGLFESHEGAGGFRYTFVVHSSDGPVAEIVYKPSEPNPRTVQYRHHDALGSVSLTTVQGGLASRRYHEPFGAHVGFDGSAAAPPMDGSHHGFTGHPHDDDVGLIDMGGRVYSASTRQFLTPDPLGRLGASPYSYVRNNPLKWIDPSGFTEEDLEGYGYSGFTSLFRSAPIAAIDVSPSLISHVVASLAAMDIPNGNDAPNSSGCPNGTGSAPLPCAAPGGAGCSPGVGSLERSYARYITPLQLSLDLPAAPGMTAERPADLGEAEWEYEALLSELTASAVADAVVDEVKEIRTDPIKKDEFAQAFWGHFVAKYEAEKLRLGVDLLVQGGLGTLGVLARGIGAAEGGIVTLYHGTTPSAASRIVQTGFRLGKDGAVFLAEDFSTAASFAREAAAKRGATGATVLRLTMPESVAAGLERGTLGAFRGAPMLDISGGTGYERILLGGQLRGFNGAMQSGVIQVQRLRLGFWD